jgi:hypothetical protein
MQPFAECRIRIRHESCKVQVVQSRQVVAVGLSRDQLLTAAILDAVDMLTGGAVGPVELFARSLADLGPEEVEVQGPMFEDPAIAAKARELIRQAKNLVGALETMKAEGYST